MALQDSGWRSMCALIFALDPEQMNNGPKQNGFPSTITASITSTTTITITTTTNTTPALAADVVNIPTSYNQYSMPTTTITTSLLLQMHTQLLNNNLSR